MNFAEDGAIVGPPQPQGLRTTTGCGIKPDPRPALYVPEEALPAARPEPTTVANLLTGDYDVYAGRRGRGFEGALGNYEGDLEAYERAFLERVESDQAFRARVLACRGLRLGCFCCDWRPGLPASIEKRLQCHAIVIAKWINAQPEEASRGQEEQRRGSGDGDLANGRGGQASDARPVAGVAAGTPPDLPRGDAEPRPAGPVPHAPPGHDGRRAGPAAGPAGVGDELRRIANDPNSAFSRMVRYAYGLPREHDLNEWPGDGMPPPGPEPDDLTLEVALAPQAAEDRPRPPQPPDHDPPRQKAPGALGPLRGGSRFDAHLRDRVRAPSRPPRVGDLRWLEENVSTSQRRETRWTLCEIVWVTDPFPCQRPDPGSPAGASRSAPGQLVEGKPVQIKGKKATKGKRLSETLLRCPASQAYVERPPLTEWEAKRRAKRKAKKAGEAAVGPLFEREGVYDAGIGDGG